MDNKNASEIEKHYSTEEKVIIYLLNDRLDEVEAAAKNEKINFYRLNQLIKKHKVTPSICKKLLSLNINGVIPLDFKKYAESRITANLAIHSYIKYNLHFISDLFTANDIEMILLKGFAVDKSSLRQMTDLDVLIKEKDIDKAFQVLESAGYQYIGSFVLNSRELLNPKKQYTWNNQFQFRVPQGHLAVEVHTNLFERDRIRTEKLDVLLNNVGLFWDRQQWDQELHCYVPAKEATLSLLCMHSAVKYCPAVNLYRLRQGYDIRNILMENIDETYFFHLCRTWEIEYYVYFSLMLTARIFTSQEAHALALKLEPSLSSAEKFLAQVHLRSYKSPERTSLFYRIIYTFCMPLIIGGGLKKALRWYKEAVFPPIWIQERRFGIRRSSPLIYFTYIYGPIRRILSGMKKQFKNT